MPGLGLVAGLAVLPHFEPGRLARWRAALETDGGDVLTPAHASGDSHPGDAFAAEVAPLFAKRLVDVIEGRGDTGSRTGR